MIGNNAKLVIFDYRSIKDNTYSRDLLDNWKRDMKAAINKDMIGEEWGIGHINYEASVRYGIACEDVIVDLLFWCKWRCLPGKPGDHENKG